MGWSVNNFPFRGILEGILEGIGDIRNTNGDVVGGRDGINNPDCRCFQDWRGGLVKVNAFHLRSTIIAMAWSILVDVITYLLDGWGQNRSEDAGCAW